MAVLLKCALLMSVAVAVSSFNLGPNDIVFHLYTRMNPELSQVLVPSMNSIMTSNFDTTVPTVVTIHSNEGFANFNAFLVTTHLQNQNVNVLAVDWLAGSGTYTEGVANAAQVGRVTADFINILSRQFGYPVSQVKIVGAGLGGHIAGIAARQADGTVPHIIAIDPSLFGWTHHPHILGPDAAALVEVLHTTSGFLGFDLPLGHLDFYPNGGSLQNGCGLDISCSHTYGIAFYSESIVSSVNNGPRFIGTACSDYTAATTMSCTGARDISFGGIEIKTSGSGIYSFVTNPTQPFATN